MNINDIIKNKGLCNSPTCIGCGVRERLDYEGKFYCLRTFAFRYAKEIRYRKEKLKRILNENRT